jgi:two-component sensor histidine kinase
MNLEDLYRLIRDRHVRSQGIVDTLTDPLLVLDANLCVETASRAFYETFNVSQDETIGHQLYELGNGQWNIPELRRLLNDVIPNASAVLDYEVTHEFPHIGRRTMLVSAHRLFHPDNISRTLLLSIVDATTRRMREREMGVLLQELKHRMKNLFAMIRALARQTIAEGRSGTAYRDAFLGRFDALIAAHDLAFSKDREIGLRELVERTLKPYATDSTAVVIEPGPAVAVASKRVLGLSLILHELATNAVKHGALSSPKGQVRVRWDIEEAANARHLRLSWRERGGPPVVPPGAVGFGTQLIEFTVITELSGRVNLTYAREGLEVEIVASLPSAAKG